MCFASTQMFNGVKLEHTTKCMAKSVSESKGCQLCKHFKTVSESEKSVGDNHQNDIITK